MTHSSIALAVQNLTRTYTSGGNPLTVLDNVSFDIPTGQTCAIVGPSGSGKTTLLGLCAGLDRPTSGTVTLNDIAIDILDEDQRAAVRNQHVGFVLCTIVRSAAIGGFYGGGVDVRLLRWVVVFSKP